MTKNINFGSYSYVLFTEREEGYIWGKCNCHDGGSGESSKACQTEEEAIEAAAANALGHYRHTDEYKNYDKVEEEVPKEVKHSGELEPNSDKAAETAKESS